MAVISYDDLYGVLHLSIVMCNTCVQLKQSSRKPLELTPISKRNNLASYHNWNISITNQFIPSTVTILVFTLVLHTFLPNFTWRIQSYPEPGWGMFSYCTSIYCLTFFMTVNIFTSRRPITCTTLQNDIHISYMVKRIIQVWGIFYAH